MVFAVRRLLQPTNLVAPLLVMASLHFLGKARGDKQEHKTHNFILALCLALASTSSVASFTLSMAVEWMSFLSEYKTAMSLAAVILLFVAAPVTHILGGHRYGNYRFYMPFSGGSNFILLQCLGWTCYGISIFLAAVYFLAPLQDRAHGLMASIGAGGLLSQLFVLFSLRFFEERFERLKTFASSASITTCILTLFLGFLAFGVLCVAERMHALALEVPYASVCTALLAVLLVLVPVTNALVGQFSHTSYRCFQPFSGGKRYVVLQALAWTVYSVAFLCMLLQLWMPFKVLGAFAGSGGLLSQVLICCSMQFFEQESKHSFNLAAMTDRFLLHVRELRAFLLVLVFFNSHFVFMGTLFYALFLASRTFQFYFWPLVAVYLVVTLRDSPSLNRRRKWDWLLKQSWVFDDVLHYFKGSVKCESELDANRQYLYGYHPHGVVPVTLLWAFYTSQWKQRGLSMVMHGASVIFKVPLMKDLACWLGGKEVSRKSVVSTLQGGESALLVPGGLAEMYLSESDSDVVKLVKRHKGFCRLAIEHGTDLVPVFGFGEVELLDHLKLPTIQGFFYRTMRVDYPHISYGRWGLPVPRNDRPITVVVGTPVAVKQNDNPSEQEVEAVHKQYYEAVARLFETHKHECGYGHQRLEFQ